MPLLTMGLQVGVGALSSFLGSSVSKYNARAQAYTQQAQALANTDAQVRQLTKAMQQQGLQNEYIAEANLQGLINSHTASALLGVRLAEQKRFAARNLSTTRRSANLALGEATANSAAAGTIGASVDAVSSDIRRKAAEGMADIADVMEQERYNTSTQINQIYTGYIQGVQRYDTTMPEAISNPILGGVPSGGGGFGSHLISSALNVGMGYLDSRLQLGNVGGGQQSGGIDWMALGRGGGTPQVTYPGQYSNSNLQLRSIR